MTKGKECGGGGTREAWRSEPADRLVWGGNAGQAHDRPGRPKQREPRNPGRAASAPRLLGHRVTDREGLGRRRRGAGGVGRRGAGRRAEPVSRGCAVLWPPARAPTRRIQAGTLSRLCPELHPIRVNSLIINPFREPEARLSLGEFEKNPRGVGKGCKVSLHWPPSCTSRCLELHP